MSVGRTVTASLDVRLALGRCVPKSKALVALDEGGVVVHSDALVFDVDTSEFQKLDADGGRDFQDAVEEFILPVPPDEPQLDVFFSSGDVVLMADDVSDV